MSDDLIKRDDALAAIDTFERDFEQSWKVQFSANIYAIPAVKDDRIEQLEAKLAKAVKVLQWIMNHRGECFIPEPWDDMANDLLADLESGQ
jgi:hypothetical protein